MWALLLAGSAQPKAPATMVSRFPPPGPIVLVVEDEPLLLMNAVSIIEDAGFVVIEATNADEAVGILASRTDIRIVFTDIDMPGSMDGLKLAAAVRGRWPPIEIIVTSGQGSPTSAELPERGIFLPKPYQPGTLVQALRTFSSGS